MDGELKSFGRGLANRELEATAGGGAEQDVGLDRPNLMLKPLNIYGRHGSRCWGNSWPFPYRRQW